jgi:hypothetical protein
LQSKKSNNEEKKKNNNNNWLAHSVFSVLYSVTLQTAAHTHSLCCATLKNNVLNERKNKIITKKRKRKEKKVE